VSSAANRAVSPRRVLPRDDLRALEGYHSPQLDVAVRLNTNESPFAPPEEFVDRWVEELRDAPLNRYPDRGARDLRTALGAHLGQPVERLFCANGSNEVLQTLLLTYGGPGRRAAIFEPTYALHSHIARITGTEVVVGERRADFSVDPEGAVALIEEHAPTIVFVCSPNNPTGTVEPAATIEALLAADGDHLVVVDEAYGEFAPWSALELVRDDRPLAVVRTYSKVWSMAALRLGFAVAPGWVVDELEKVVLPYHLASATQIAGRLALDLGDEMDDRVHRLVAERERVAAELDRTDGVTVSPSGANFLLFRPAGDGHDCWQQMVDHGVLVRDFSRWPRLEGCLRVTIGTPEENDAFLAALRSSLQEVPEREMPEREMPEREMPEREMPEREMKV
jgi:histidinol-phosphate aminotransferase